MPGQPVRIVRQEWHGEQVIDRVRNAALDGLFSGAERVSYQSDATIPTDTNRMRLSGRVSMDRMGKEAAVSYNTVYAPRQHEDLTYRHKPGQGAKFLSRALGQESVAVLGDIGSAIRAVIGL